MCILFKRIRSCTNFGAFWQILQNRARFGKLKVSSNNFSNTIATEVVTPFCVFLFYENSKFIRTSEELKFAKS